MIYGIGIDIVEVSRFKNMKSIDAFANKCLTYEELSYFNGLEKTKKPTYLAKQFCIKEAISKAFGTGIRQEVLLSNISVARDELGKPVFIPLNNLKDKMNDLGISASHVSLADEKNYVVAFAILER